MNIQCTRNASTVNDQEINDLLQQCNQTFDIFKAQLIETNYNSPYSFVRLPYDQTMHQKVQKMVDQKKQYHIAAMVVVGIGGSNLGARAIHQFLYGQFEQLLTIPIYYADTVDANYIGDIKKICHAILERGDNILVIIISKSGHTIETIANGQIFIDLLSKFKKNDFHQYIVTITDYDSSLWRWAQKYQCDLLEIPQCIGGRYSIMSAAGLFPLAMAGINIEELCRGAQDITPGLLIHSSDNISAMRAAIIFALFNKNYIIHDFFVFCIAGEDLGKWYRQLIGESLGKEYNLSGQKVYTGITPTVSVGTIDLHSVGQLYLGGPYDKFTTFLTIQNNQNNDSIISNEYKFSELVDGIKNHTLSDLMSAIAHGTMNAYRTSNRPFMHIVFPQKNAYYIGQFMQICMVETVYLAHLMRVNAFDQPQVELYKKESRTLF